RAEREKNSDGKKRKKGDTPPIKPDEIPFEIPKTWEWVRLGEIVEDVRYGTAQKCHPNAKGTAVLRIPNVVNGEVDLSDLKYASLSKKELSELTLENGDVLLIRSNGSLHIVGRMALVREHAEQMAFAGYLIRI